MLRLPVYVSNQNMPAEQEINRPRCRPLDDEPRGLVMRGGSGDILTQDLAIADDEPARVFRRLFGLSYAAMGMASSWA